MVQILNENKIRIVKRVLFFIVPQIIFWGSFLLLWHITGSQSLRHDEAVYLTKARSWIEGTPANEWRIYRPIGTAVFGWIFLLFTNSEPLLRIFGDIFGALSLVFIYLLFKLMSNVWVALSIVFVVCTSPVFLQHAPQFLNDIPAGGLLVGSLWLIWDHYEKAGRSKLIYLTAPLAILSFYTRYGVAISLGSIGLLSLLTLAKKFSSKKDV